MSLITAEEVLKDAGFTASDIGNIRSGKLVKQTVSSTSDRELAAQFALLVKVPASELKEAFMTGSKKKETDDTITDMGLVADDPALEDFMGVALEPNGDKMTKTYLIAAPGSDLNLSEEEIQKFNGLKKSGGKQEQVETVLREVLFERLRTYKCKGLKGIAPYARSGKNYDPGKELYDKTTTAKILKARAPAFYNHVLNYPEDKPDGVEEIFSWFNYSIDDKPTICLSHKMLKEENGGIVFYERHFYVSRSHNSMQRIGGASPVDEGTICFVLSRTSTDQVSGFGGAAKRKIGAQIMAGKIADNFEKMRESYK
mmetsp:Transcript_35295/g.72225  ORF Transcript_35295/g.72225 Transcript_35295/m.72225 type:complete len:313 (-) Transcript_35295:374-1312(-)